MKGEIGNSKVAIIATPFQAPTLWGVVSAILQTVKGLEEAASCLQQEKPSSLRVVKDTESMRLVNQKQQELEVMIGNLKEGVRLQVEKLKTSLVLALKGLIRRVLTLESQGQHANNNTRIKALEEQMGNLKKSLAPNGGRRHLCRDNLESDGWIKENDIFSNKDDEEQEDWLLKEIESLGTKS
ncbi:hypothetical protein ACA910_006427 [Epithemia clementina (nom. ined.)]